jgi:hypothetical protein
MQKLRNMQVSDRLESSNVGVGKASALAESLPERESPHPKQTLAEPLLWRIAAPMSNSIKQETLL